MRLHLQVNTNQEEILFAFKCVVFFVVVVEISFTQFLKAFSEAAHVPQHLCSVSPCDSYSASQLPSCLL